MWLMMKLHHIICTLLQVGMTALHWAADEGHIPVVEALIRLGADVNAVDEVS